MVRYFLLSLVFLIAGTAAFAQTSLQGKLTDAESGEPILFGTVALYKNGVLVTGVETDFDGNYSIANIDPGTYDVEASYVGYQAQRIAGVIVSAGKANKLDIKLSEGVMLEEVVVIDYKVPLIEQDNTTQGAIVTSEQIRQLPTKNINALAATSAGLSSADEGGAVSVRGSRSNATDYYIDGIRVSGNLIPESEIAQMQVITGGIEAQYGDVTGGIISITTKGPSGKFSGGLELETSEFLDEFGYNMASLNLSGPILKNKKGESVLGYRFSGRYRDQKDDGPTATGVYQVNDDQLAILEANPVTRLGESLFAGAESLTDEDVTLQEARPNEESTRIDVTGKIDARLTKNIDITFTGSYTDSKNRFTPSNAWFLMNTQNNPMSEGNTYRGIFRFRHRLGSNTAQEDESGQKKVSAIQNASYTLQFGYEKSLSDVYDYNHEDRLFDYGYVGAFDWTWEPIAGESPWTGGVDIPFVGQSIAHVDYRKVFQGYTPGTVNPVLAAYNNSSDLSNFDDLLAINGFTAGTVTSSWGLHTNVGTVYNNFQQSDNDRYTFNANSSFDLVPGGSEKGRHSIQFGLLYEQRVNRGYVVSPRGLWVIADLQANRHILGVDTNNVVGTFEFAGVELPEFQTLIADFPDLQFYRNVREVTGQSLHEYVNVDALSPDQLSLDMFSSRELTDQGIVDYFGYDYLGNITNSDITFDDFFEINPATGQRDYLVAPNKPIYSAAYIQDKFTFKDIIFRLGVRVDRYDANTKVLKDPFSLYGIMNASDFHNQTGEDRPGGIGDDFSVYVDGPNSNAVKAYRDEEQWYFANGTPANDGRLIFGGEIVTPKYADSRYENPQFIKDAEFETSDSFEDYEPQVNWMPRLAFSFPISDAANFFAHYDVLVQRPPSNTIATALDYFYFNDPGRTPSNNPNLKPERTVDYEVGFQQKLTNSSAIKISAYYKEMRDMIQSRTFLFLPAPVNSYESFGNIDFGTVKGFSFQYDLRRTGNVQLTANYTLQFADGTGSNALSQRGLTDRGNIRTLFPLDFDERHRFNVVLDYRYGSGKRYTGPRWLGSDVFANAGANLQIVTVSGRPFTKKVSPEQFGGAGTEGAINGARKPWNFTVNLRVDKSFTLSKPDAKNRLGLNVYFRVSNLLDARNILSVYSATGSAEDDGYLESSQGQSALEQTANSGRDVDAFIAAYNWRLLNPGFYTLPRRMYLGAIFEF